MAVVDKRRVEGLRVGSLDPQLIFAHNCNYFEKDTFAPKINLLISK